MKVSAVIPTLNPSEKIFEVVKNLKKADFKRIIVVNDGSKSDCNCIFQKLKTEYGCIVLTHQKNYGKGKGLKTAMAYFLQNPCDDIGIITLDDDGQHTIKDVVNCANALMDNTDKLILGTRNFNSPNVPLKSKCGNKITSKIFQFVCGLKISDTQTGLRAMSKDLIKIFINTVGDRFEYETNMLIDCKENNIKIKEVIIDTVYIEGNRATHFHPLRDSYMIYKRLLKFIFSSGISFLIDILLFTLLMYLFPISSMSAKIFTSTVISRISSSLFNFFANRKLVFSNNNYLPKTMVKYYILCIMQMFVSSFLVSGISFFFASSLTTLWKIFVDIFLFFCSYKIQEKWVFAKDNKKTDMKKIIKGIYHTALSIIFTVLCCIILITSLITTVFFGPSQEYKNLLVNTFMETSALKFIPHIYFSKEEIENITVGNQKQINEYINSMNNTKIDIKPKDNISDSEKSDIIIEKVTGSTYMGTIMIIKDPSRISLYTIPEFSDKSRGKLLSEVQKELKVTGAFNGGAFFDENGMGTGGMPKGIVIANGKLLSNTVSEYSTLIGFDKESRLVCENITAEQALKMGVRDAVTFGPVLVKNGEKVPQLGSGGGLNPRTAIGQCADGTVLVLVIDGRQPHSLGATFNDLAQIMLEYGAVTAGNLDGGSSSMLFHNGKMINSLSSAVGERPIPTAFIIK